jgi:mono/diheme cytochrome c family protein
MRLKSWRTAALCISTIAFLPEYSIFVPRLRAQEANRHQQQHVIPALDGPTLFITYCAVCHGRAADGRGPMAPILKTAVPDLTKIAKRNGGVFPVERVENVIAGTEPSGLAHGTREMPLWGPLFSQITSDRDYGKVRLYNSAKYLESIQKK